METPDSYLSDDGDDGEKKRKYILRTKRQLSFQDEVFKWTIGHAEVVLQCMHNNTCIHR